MTNFKNIYLFVFYVITKQKETTLTKTIIFLKKAIAEYISAPKVSLKAERISTPKPLQKEECGKISTPKVLLKAERISTPQPLQKEDCGKISTPKVLQNRWKKFLFPKFRKCGMLLLSKKEIAQCIELN